MHHAATAMDLRPPALPMNATHNNFENILTSSTSEGINAETNVATDTQSVSHANGFDETLEDTTGIDIIDPATDSNVCDSYLSHGKMDFEFTAHERSLIRSVFSRGEGNRETRLGNDSDSTPERKDDLHDIMIEKSQPQRGPSLQKDSVQEETTPNQAVCVDSRGTYLMDLLRREVKHALPDTFIDTQSNITLSDRTVLVDWIVQVHNKQDMPPETLFLAVNILDRFLATKEVSTEDLQLVGLSALWIARKFNDTSPPPAMELISYCDGLYSTEDLYEKEKAIVLAIQFNLMVPTAWDFLGLLQSAIGNIYGTFSNVESSFCSYLLELALLDRHMQNYRPSLQAVVVCRLALQFVRQIFSWNSSLYETCGGWNDAEMSKCAKDLGNVFKKVHFQVGDNMPLSTRRKFSLQNFCFLSAILSFK